MEHEDEDAALPLDPGFGRGARPRSGDAAVSSSSVQAVPGRGAEGAWARGARRGGLGRQQAGAGGEAGTGAVAARASGGGGGAAYGHPPAAAAATAAAARVAAEAAMAAAAAAAPAAAEVEAPTAAPLPGW